MPKKPVKPGKYVEASIDTIHEGEFRDEVESLVRRAYEALDAHEKKTGQLGGKVKGTITFEVDRNGEEFVNFTYATDLKLPKIQKVAMIRGAQGRLLSDPDGDSLNDKDQGKLITFDRFGNKRAAIDRATGEVAEDDPADNGVAGAIGG